MDCWLPTAHLLATAAPYHGVVHQENERHQQEQMNYGAGDVNDEVSEHPKDDENDRDGPHHSRHPLSQRTKHTHIA